MNNNVNIFVYGSLREGFFNYDKYLKGKVLSIKPAKLKNMIVYHMPYKGYPAILNGEGTVYGEIMEIKPEIYTETMEAMDKMEGFISDNNPQNEYHKKIFEIEPLSADEHKEKCFVYFYNGDIDDKFADEAIFVNHGDWVKFMKEKK